MEGSNELLRALAGLRVTEPRAEWAERVRKQCHGRLARVARKAKPKLHRMGALDAAALTALWLYLVLTLGQAAQIVALRSPFN